MTLSKFRQIVGDSAESIASAIGYTREGLYKAFSNTNNQNHGFKTLVHGYLEKKVQEENERHEARMKELHDLQQEYKPFNIYAKELDKKIHFLKAR